MEDNSEHSDDNDSQDMDKTIYSPGNMNDLQKELANMKILMQEMEKSLQNERSNSQRLTNLLEQQQQQTIADEANNVLLNQQVTSNIHPSLPVNAISFPSTSPVLSSTNNMVLPNQEVTSYAHPPLPTEIPSTSRTNHDQTGIFMPNQGSTIPVNTIAFPSPSTVLSSSIKRKIIDLPTFSGRPEEWPAFSIAFRESNANMGYSNWENHLRLSKSLVGLAKESVEALMIHPNNVEAVMSELQRQFGQNELLLRSQLEKVRQIQPVLENRLDQLIPFATKVRNLAAFLETMNSVPHLANPNLIDELVRKLPQSKRVDWGMYAIQIKPYTTVRDFSNWLSNLAHVISVINISTSVGHTVEKPTFNKGTRPKVLHANSVSSSSSVPTCLFCELKHNIMECNGFKQISVSDRWTFVKAKRLCFSCLRVGHSTYMCRSRKPCKKEGCQKLHHILLHEPDPNVVIDNTVASHSVHCATSALYNTNDTEVLFKIVPVRLYSQGRSIDTFAMLDEGSSVTLVDESLLTQLGVSGREEQLTLQWFGNRTSTEPSQVVDIEISATNLNAPKYKLKEVRSVKQIDLPIQTLNLVELNRNHRNIKKLPINEYTDAKPLILIGLNNSFLGAPLRTSGDSSWNGPIAMKTKLGWIVYGPHQTQTRSPRCYQFHINKLADDSLEKRMDEYFTTENFGVKICALESESDKLANQLLQSTTVKLENRYQTGLLWKDPKVVLPSSYNMAKKRLLAIEKKMSNNAEFKEMYVQKMNENLMKGYARKLTPSEATATTDRTWYLPHFAISNLNKPGKHRLVFDAAAKVDGLSLNDYLLKGPDSYNSLVDVLYNFRRHPVGVVADIKEMFSQIVIQQSDKNSQRFLWRDNGDPSKPIEEFIMDVMTFGVTCSPASAHYVKNVNANMFLDEHPEAVHSIVNHHYVDDFVDSFQSVDHAKKISMEIKGIHKHAGFELRGFVSNSREVSDFLNEYSPSDTKRQMNLESSSTEKILGMIWDPSDDSFKFELKFNRVPKDVISGERRPTKRELLSVTMSVFDPFGLLCNITIHLKVMIQEIWRLRVGWDEAVPDEVSNKWTMWRNVLEKVKLFKIPRFFLQGLANPINIEIHTFVDSSEEAFAAVSYLRIFDGQTVGVRFMCAKNRCSPIKQLLSIPRLELQSAVLGSRLSSSVIASCNLTINKRFFWSDSATVISWIKSDHRKYKPFVAHRISEILERTSPEEWNWLSTKINIADEATRAKYPIKYEPTGTWVRGPDFLFDDPSLWPKFDSSFQQTSQEEELRTKFVCVVVPKIALLDINRFSNFIKLRRILAWVRRFVTNKFGMDELRKGELTVSELKKSDLLLCRMVQNEVFAEEIATLRLGNQIKRSSSIYKLSPVLDEDGILRVNSRIRRATVIPCSMKTPIILPRNHAVSNLILDYYHKKNHHQNRNAIITEIRQQYWIPSVKSLVNNAKFRCQECKNRSAAPEPPLMGELPYDRLAAYVRPFSYCGVDYFGPLDVTVGRRREKRWVALFTCLTVRAVHLELAADLSTDSCLLCIRNFVNRRGIPVRIRSDNGTNFVAASKELKDAINALDHTRIQAEMSTNKIEWVFNSPDNPEAGGAWERLVQSVKRVLSYTLFEEAPKVETLQSLLIEAESIVNNRPLTDVPLSYEEDDVITPNHFLLGTANYTQTPGEDDRKIWCLRKQWRISQQLKNRFWKKWVDDYLPTLICRSKWNSKVDPIKVGDIALIVDNNLARRHWTKGRIVEVYPGKDEQVRRVKIKTSTGELKRPACKVAVLDVRPDCKRSMDQDQ